MKLPHERLAEMATSVTKESIAQLATDLGHLLAECGLTSEQARKIRLGLLWGRKGLESTLAADVLVALLFAYEFSMQDRENYEIRLNEVRNASGQTWKSGGGGWRVVHVKDDDVHLQGPGPCRSYMTVPIDVFARFWTRVQE
jgi:hypothetical protein